MRTPEQIFKQTLDLARQLYSIRGYTVPEGHRFDLATHGHETQAWEGACAAQLMLTETDVDDVLSEMDWQPTLQVLADGEQKPRTVSAEHVKKIK